MELHIAAWAAMQSNVMCDKLNLLLRVQELEIDYCILLSPIFYSWMWLRSVYLFQKFWLWYGLVNAEKGLMTCMELIKRTCSFCMFSWRCSPAHVGAAWPARVCSLAWKPCSPSNRLFDSYRCWVRRGHLWVRKSSFCGWIPPTTSS